MMMSTLINRRRLIQTNTTQNANDVWETTRVGIPVHLNVSYPVFPTDFRPSPDPHASTYVQRVCDMYDPAPSPQLFECVFSSSSSSSFHSSTILRRPHPSPSPQHQGETWSPNLRVNQPHKYTNMRFSSLIHCAFGNGNPCLFIRYAFSERSIGFNALCVVKTLCLGGGGRISQRQRSVHAAMIVYVVNVFRAA